LVLVPTGATPSKKCAKLNLLFLKDEFMKVKLILIITVAILFSGCVVPTAREMQANPAELAKVRIVPVSQVNSCEFITQTNIVQGQSFFGGQAELGSDAETRMKKKALSLGADTMVLTDRIYDDGAGGKKQPTLSLYADLYKCKSESVSTKSESVSTKSESVPVSKNALLEVQTKLKDMGYYSGTIDGISGPQTARAIGAFQKDKNLPFTGNVDSATLDELNIGR
jgi:hypothetical protein